MTAQTVTVTAAADLDATDDTVTLTHSASGGDYASVSVPDLTVRVKDNDLPGSAVRPDSLTIDEGDSTGGSYSIVLTGEPTGTVRVAVGGATGTDVTASPTSLTFTTSDWNTAQTVTVSAANDRDLADDTVTLSHSATGGGYGSAALPNVTVRVKDSGSEVNVSTERVAIHEGDDAGGTYSVVLTRAPTGTVTITIGGNSGTDVTVNPASLTFTTSTWNTAQTVTVSAANDTDVADDWVTLSHSASGGGYGTTALPSVTVHVQDRGPEVEISTGRMTILEGDEPGGTYSVVLAREPTGTVTVTIGGTSGTDVTVNPASLTFTTSTWNTRQTVSVSAAEDNDSDADTASITHTASGGGIGSVPISSVTVEVRDDDRRVVATPRQMNLDEGATASYELRAKGWPETTVTVSVDVPSGSDVTVNPSTVTFTPSNWDQPRTIQVSAAHDADWGSETVTVEHPVSGAEADTFAVNSVKVTVDDDDRVRAWIDDGGGVNVTEGGRGSYKIWLQRAPSAPGDGDGDEDVEGERDSDQPELRFDGLVRRTNGHGRSGAGCRHHRRPAPRDPHRQRREQLHAAGQSAGVCRRRRRRGDPDRYAAGGRTVVGGAHRAVGDRRDRRIHRLHEPPSGHRRALGQRLHPWRRGTRDHRALRQWQRPPEAVGGHRRQLGTAEQHGAACGKPVDDARQRHAPLVLRYAFDDDRAGPCVRLVVGIAQREPVGPGRGGGVVGGAGRERAAWDAGRAFRRRRGMVGRASSGPGRRKCRRSRSSITSTSRRARRGGRRPAVRRRRRR